MPLESGEVLSRSVQQVGKALQDVQVALSELGSGRDGVARDKLRRARLLVEQCSTRAQLLHQDMDPSLETLWQQFLQKKQEFEALNAEATRRERLTFRQGGEPTSHGSDFGATATDFAFHEVRPIDLSEFRTEEAIQREKLQHAREIESDVQDLKTTYLEFHSLVHQQQEGLDNLTGNVAESRALIERGHGEIEGASRRQKSFRKIGCIGGIVLVIVIVVAIILAIVLTR